MGWRRRRVVAATATASPAPAAAPAAAATPPATLRLPARARERALGEPRARGSPRGLIGRAAPRVRSLWHPERPGTATGTRLTPRRGCDRASREGPPPFVKSISRIKRCRHRVHIHRAAMADGGGHGASAPHEDGTLGGAAAAAGSAVKKSSQGLLTRWERRARRRVAAGGGGRRRRGRVQAPSRARCCAPQAAQGAYQDDEPRHARRECSERRAARALRHPRVVGHVLVLHHVRGIARRVRAAVARARALHPPGTRAGLWRSWCVARAGEMEGTDSGGGGQRVWVRGDGRVPDAHGLSARLLPLVRACV